ncbi:MAG: hypothetical protein ACO3GE_10925 [Steroidobacteraceae bacterium]
MGRHRLFVDKNIIEDYARKIRGLGGEVSLASVRERHRMKTGKTLSTDRISDALREKGWRYSTDLGQFVPPEYDWKRR